MAEASRPNVLFIFPDQWRGRLAKPLADRLEDGFVDNGTLKPGRDPVIVRDWLLEASLQKGW